MTVNPKTPDAQPLAIIGGAQAAELAKNIEAPVMNFLPKLSMMWTIQNTPYSDRMCILHDNTVVPLGTDVTQEDDPDNPDQKIAVCKSRAKPEWRIAAFLARPGVRWSEKTNKGTKNHWAFYNGPTAEKCAEYLAKTEGKVSKGRSYLVGVIEGERCAICAMDLASTQVGYWADVLKAAQPEKGAIVRVNVASHKNFLDGDVGAQYYSNKLFQQEKHWFQEEITKEQRELLNAAANAPLTKEAIDGWLKR